MALDTSDFRNGLKIELDGEPYVITYFQHVKPGKGGAFVRTKLKGLKSGRTIEKTFNAGHKVQEADVSERRMQYLYQDGDSAVFMDTDNYEQLSLPFERLGEDRRFLRENIEVEVLLYKGEAVKVELPPFIIAPIVSTDPGVKGDTATGGSKPATLDSGAVVQVPLFIKEGEKVRVDTRSGEYVERVND